MKTNRLRSLFPPLTWPGVLAALFLGLAWTAPAATRYVDANSAAPAFPFTSWATAATSIQDAVDASVAGEDILVTNGVYANGGKVKSGTMTNRVAINKAVTVRSVGGGGPA